MKYLVLVSIIVMGLNLIGCSNERKSKDAWWYSGDIPSDITLR